MHQLSILPISLHDAAIWRCAVFQRALLIMVVKAMVTTTTTTTATECPQIQGSERMGLAVLPYIHLFWGSLSLSLLALLYCLFPKVSTSFPFPVTKYSCICRIWLHDLIPQSLSSSLTLSLTRTHRGGQLNMYAFQLARESAEIYNVLI